MSSTSYTQLNLNNNNFTIEFWLYIPCNQSASIITYLPTYSNFSTKLVSNILYCYLGSTIMIAGRTPLQINQWYHIAVVRSNTTAISTFFIFINGSLDNYSTAAQTMSLNIANVLGGTNVYPPAAMTANQTTITGQAYGNGEYIASASSFVNIPSIPQVDPPYLAFNKSGGTDNNMWGASAAVYNSSSPYIYIGTVQTITNTTINTANVTISPGLVNNWAMNSGTIVIISGTSFGGLLPGSYIVDQLITNTIVSLYGFVATSTALGSMTLSTAQSPTFTTIINNIPTYGEYLDILLPNEIILTSYSIQSRSDTGVQAPGTWYLLGTNNGGSIWTQLDNQTAIVYTANQIQTFSITNALAFKEYRIVITAVSGASSGYLSIAEMYLYGSQYTNVQTGINNNDVIYQIGNFTGFIDEVRVTNGIARYTANFVIPQAPFPSAQITDYTTIPNDNLYTYTTLMLPLNGNIIDYSIYSNTLSVGGITPSITYSSNSKFAGKSFSFNGTTVLRTSANKTIMFGADPFTIEFWMNPSATQPTVARIMGNATTSSYGSYTWAITFASNVIGFIVGTTQVFTSSIIIPNNSWTHVAIVKYISTQYYLYINGVLSSSPIPSTYANGGTRTGPVNINGINYYIHTFTTVGNNTFTVIGGTLICDILVVAGGGGTGFGTSGGGGAGGFQYFQSQTIAAGIYTVTVGAGGLGNNTTGAGTQGGNSQFGSLTASIGGGYGCNGIGGNGGSGGSSSSGSSPGSGTPGQGYAGGTSVTGGNFPCGGGGGAGSVGGNGSGAIAGNGGVGLICNINGVATYYAGGGGGGINSATAGTGGLGGGGNGVSTNGIANSGLPNTGGGGGGTGSVGFNGTGGNGGSGIVILRYKANISLDGADITPPVTSYLAVGGDGAGLSTSTSGYYAGLLSQVRLTRYYPRYLAPFTPPSTIFPQVDTLTSATSLNYYYGAQLVVSNWITRIAQAGGTISALYAQYHINFVATLLNQNIWQKIYRLNTFSGDQLTAALVPLKITPGYGMLQESVGGSNFLTYNSTGSSSGILGDASTNFIDTSMNLNTITSTGKDLHMGLWIFSTSATGVPMGVYSGANPIYPTTRTYIPYAAPGTSNYWGSNLQYSSQTAAGLYLMTNDTFGPIVSSNISPLITSTAAFYVNGTQVALTNTQLQNYSQPSDWSVTLLAMNGSSNGLNSDSPQVITKFSNSRIGIYTIGSHLLPQDQLAYYRAMNHLNTVMGRT